MSFPSTPLTVYSLGLGPSKTSSDAGSALICAEYSEPAHRRQSTQSEDKFPPFGMSLITPMPPRTRRLPFTKYRDRTTGTEFTGRGTLTAEVHLFWLRDCELVLAADTVSGDVAAHVPHISG